MNSEKELLFPVNKIFDLKRIIFPDDEFFITRGLFQYYACLIYSQI